MTPRRKRVRLRHHDYGGPAAYFVTVCTRGRACIFGDVVDDRTVLSSLGQAAEVCWRAIPCHFQGVSLDSSVVMPNHIHGVLHFVGAGYIRPLQDVIGTYKAAVSRLAKRPVWQRSYFEHVVRNENDLDEIREYIENDPLNWALDRENPSFAPRRGAGLRA